MRVWLLLLLVFVCAQGLAQAEENWIIRDENGYSWNKYKDRPPVPLPFDEGRDSFERVNDPAHLVFTGLGVARDQNLIVDQSGPAQFFALLGKTQRIPGQHPMVPCFGYKSNLPGDSTILLVTVDECPEICNRIFEIELRRNAQDYTYIKHLHPTTGVNKDIATQSGLRLGLTRDEVKAILGWPHREDKETLVYGVQYKHFFTEQEVLARGHDAKYAREWELVFRFITIGFTNDRASRVDIYQRITWD